MENHAADLGLVPARLACPKCGERRVTVLLSHDDTIECCACNTIFEWPEEDRDGSPRIVERVASAEHPVAIITRGGREPAGGCHR